MEWCLAGWLVCVPLLVFLCTIKSSSLLAPADWGDPGKRVVFVVVVPDVNEGTHSTDLVLSSSIKQLLGFKRNVAEFMWAYVTPIPNHVTALFKWGEHSSHLKTPVGNCCILVVHSCN